MSDDKNVILKNISDNTDTIRDKLNTLKTSELGNELSASEKKIGRPKISGLLIVEKCRI